MSISQFSFLFVAVAFIAVAIGGGVCAVVNGVARVVDKLVIDSVVVVLAIVVVVIIAVGIVAVVAIADYIAVVFVAFCSTIILSPLQKPKTNNNNTNHMMWLLNIVHTQHKAHAISNLCYISNRLIQLHLFLQ